MTSTQKNNIVNGANMFSDKEEFLCSLLDNGSKCLKDEIIAFQKKSFDYFKN
jgi:hypothetical protein